MNLNSKGLLRTITKAVTFFFFWSALCPAPGWRNTAHAFSVGEEKEVGEKLLTLVRKEFKLLDQPDIEQYINNLGRDILAVAGPQYFDYHFFVINNKEFNAFAAPSGLIFLHTGLIETMGTEGELVSVMAHEVGHVESRHIAERIKKSSKVNIGTAVLMIAGLALGGGALSEALVTGSLAAGATMNLQFSRQDEEEADRQAYKWMKQMKRDPAAMQNMLQKMRKVSLFSRGKIPPYLLTHPEPAMRLGYVQDLLFMDNAAQYAPHDDFAFQRIKYRILVLSKDVTDLLPHFRKDEANHDSGKSIMAAYGLSQVYLSTGDFDKAEQYLQKVMKHYPTQPILQTDLGAIYFQSGRYKKALQVFAKARKSAPACAHTAFFLGRAHEELGNKAKALRLYKELLPVLPTYSRLHYRIGQLMAAQGKTGAGHYHLGVYFWYEGDPKTARFHLSQALKKLAPADGYRTKADAMLKKISHLEKV